MKFNLACILLIASLLPLSTLWLRAADTPPAAPTPVAQDPHAEANIRRNLAMNANQAISDGQRFLGSGNYDEAAKRFQFALDSLSPSGAAAASYHRAEIGLAAAKAGQANGLAKDYKFAEAATLLQQAVILQPENPIYAADIEELKKQQLAYEAQIRDPEGTQNNPAVTEEFKGRVATVQKLLFQGDAYFRTGQYDKAEDAYSKILILDPYNKAARDKMAHIERYKERAYSFRHEQYEGAAMEKVAHDWSEDISPDIIQKPGQDNIQQTQQSNRAIIARKLQSIIIDKVNFEKLDIAAVIQFLQQKSKELDPDHVGINFVLRLTADQAPVPAPTPSAAAATTTDSTAAATAAASARTIRREVSITLTDVPLSDILGYVIAQTNLQYSVEDYAVYLRPSIDEGDTLTVRTYLVPPNFFSGSTLSVTPTTSPDSPTTISSVSIPVQQALTDKGIRFPSGATATFLPGSSKLVVRNTPEQLDLITNLIEQLSKEIPQVEIEAKLAEFNQDAIKALSFNYFVGLFNGATGVSIGTSTNFGVSTSLRNANSVGSGTGSPAAGIGGLRADNISSLVLANPGNGSSLSPLTGTPVVGNNLPNTLSVGGIIDKIGLAVIINAINNLQGVSLLSAPTVTTQSGLKANIDIVQEFPYPTNFEKPKLSNSANIQYLDSNATLTLAIPPTPREFVTQDVGVSLEVKPTTYPDQRIDLDIAKAQVLDFDGFIDYGVPIRARNYADARGNGDAAGEGIELTPGVINQPVFNLRSIVTNLQVLDGQTAVLGGLLREDTQEFTDKVPVLGDLPIIGRAFQSKVSQRIKRNLLIFVTARLIKTNGKPLYVKTLDAEPQEEVLPEPDSTTGQGTPLPSLPAESPNS